MSERNSTNNNTRFFASPARPVHACDDDWIEIFRDRIAEDLKRVLQEDMEWTTSRQILERLNRLRDIEKARLRSEDGLKREEIRKAS